MPQQELLSIVIPTHNTKKLVLGCLESLEASASAGWALEIIVVDDASTDGSAEAILGRFPDIRVLSHDRAQGFSKAANAGLKAAKGSRFLLLNSDTRLPSLSLEALEREFEEHGVPQIIGAQLLNPDGSPQWSGGDFPSGLWLFALTSGLGALRSRLMRPDRRNSGEAGRVVDWVSGAAMAFDRRVWEQVGPLDESFSFYGQDLDFCRRARKAGIETILLPDFRVVHEHGGTVQRRGSAVGTVDPGLLWIDLLRYVELHHSPEVFRRFRRLMRLGAKMRLAGRGVVGLSKKGEARRQWMEDSDTYRRAAAELSRNAASP